MSTSTICTQVLSQILILFIHHGAKHLHQYDPSGLIQCKQLDLCLCIVTCSAWSPSPPWPCPSWWFGKHFLSLASSTSHFYRSAVFSSNCSPVSSLIYRIQYFVTLAPFMRFSVISIARIILRLFLEFGWSFEVPVLWFAHWILTLT